MAKRILVIDDEAQVRDAFVLALTGMGYDVVGAAGGNEALLEAAKQTPDLIFLDLRMPGMDGLEVLRRLQSRFPGVPVYIATAYQRDFMRPLRSAASAGYRFEVVDKPLDRDQIRAVVVAAFGSHAVF